MKLHLVIETENLSVDTLEKLLGVLYVVEDQSMYKCKSVSHSIDNLQTILYKNNKDNERGE